MEENAEVKSRLLPCTFFEAPPERVAPRLLGKVLAVHAGRSWISGRIVEVEAYLGPHNTPPDPAAHSFRGPTPRNRILFDAPGHAYVYSIYGQYFCMNVTCEPEGRAGCILIRALEPLTGLPQMARNRGVAADASPALLTSGPGRLCQALGLTREAHNGLDLTSPRSPLRILDDGFHTPQALVTVRIGIRHAVDWPMRFALPGNACVSGPRRLQGNLSPVT
jgi:DNA-3-methyladenine glycosylase